MSKKRYNKNILPEKKSDKGLLVALLSGLVTINSPAYAQNITLSDWQQKPVNTPTLDYLYQKDMSSVNSGYNLSKITVSDGSYLPKSTIARHEIEKATRYYNPQTGEIVAANALEDGVDYYSYDVQSLDTTYHTVRIRQTEYGIKDGASETKYFNWGFSTQGWYNLPEAPYPSGDNNIKYHVNSKVDQSALPFITNGVGATITNTNATLDTVRGAFVGNNAYLNGGVKNIAEDGKTAKIGEITGHFIGNNAYVNTGVLEGGAIVNRGEGATIDNIVADFIGNYLYSAQASVRGGAIFNSKDAKISSITGDFIGNAVATQDNPAHGGAIYNAGTIDNIIGGFYDNTVTVNKIDNNGGAIYNVGLISSITGEFSGNTGYFGGAVFNAGTIESLKADFLKNDSFYGAIANSGVIDSIEGNFIDNYGYTSASIHNVTGAEIKSINGNFIGNVSNHPTTGAVIENCKDANIGTIGALFLDNDLRFAIENQGGFINSIISDFISNSGGGINNYGSIVSINSLFMDNGYIALHNKKTGVINSLKSDFINNDSISLYNEYGIVESIIGDFISNKAKGVTNTYGTIGLIDASFIGNSTVFSNKSPMYGAGAAIHNHEGFIDLIMGEFIENTTNGVNNYGGLGGAIYNTTAPTSPRGIIKEIRADFIGNAALANDEEKLPKEAYGGAIYNEGTIQAIVNSNFIDNYAKSNYGIARGGAIYSLRDLNIVADNGTSQFAGNYVLNGSQKDYQAIFMGSSQMPKDERGYELPATLNLRAVNNGTLIMDDKISGLSNVNMTQIMSYSTPNGVVTVYVDENNQEITDPSLYKYGNYKINFNGDASGKIVINNDIEAVSASDNGVDPAADMNLYTVTLKLGNRDNVLDGNNLTMNSGTLDMINRQIGVADLNTLNIAGETSLNVDVDLVAKTMDTIKADNYVYTAGSLNVTGMNLLNDAPQGQEVTEIYFADSALKDYVADATGGALPQSQYQLKTPIYQYNVAYDNRPDSGWFIFARGDKIIVPSPGGNGGGGVDIKPSGNPSDAFNPAVLASPVASQVGAMATIGQTFNYAFQNSDNFMANPYLKRVASRNANKYALTDNGVYSPLYSKADNSSVWVKPYSTFESVSLKNGPKVSNVAYGTLIGFDSEMEHLKHGWDRVWTGYIGYNGSNQSFSGVDTTQSGGLIGATMTMYKGNFFNATTLTTGASVAFNTNMYGNEHFSMLMAGIGNKSGYNYEFKDGKIILQPNMLVNYSFVNTFDYRNAAGVKLNVDPLHSIQLVPGLKVIGNLKNGWQPYASVNMIWNLMGQTDVTANGIKLPEMSIKPYVQYGVGVQKTIKDRSMAFGQVMIRNGGRSGVALSAGFRWALGKDGKPIEKVSNPQNVSYSVRNDGRKVLKQMNTVKRSI